MKTLITLTDDTLINNVFDAATLARLAALGEVSWLHRMPASSAQERQCLFDQIIGEFDACISSWGSPKFTSQTLANAKRLKFLGHAAGTLVPYLLDAQIFEREIHILTASEILAKSTAELALALMMAGAWNLHSYELAIKQGVWSKTHEQTVLGLQGQTIGLIGLGATSRRLIELLAPFKARVLLYSQHTTDAQAAALGVERCDLNTLLAQSRIVSLHNTLTAQTKGMLGREQIELMGDGALLVNTARAALVNNAALLEHLQAGRISAAFDVFDQEPLPVDHALLKLPNVLCAPHIGGISSYWRKQIGATLVDALERFSHAEGKITLEGEITKARFLSMSAN